MSQAEIELLPEHKEKLEEYLLEDEQVKATYSGSEDSLHQSFVVTDQRFFEIATDGSKTDVGSTTLKGEHITGSSVSTDTESEGAEFGFLIMIAGVAGWWLGLFGWIIGGLLVVAGLVVAGAAIRELTVITIQTKQGIETIEIPEDAEFLGKEVSKVIARSSPKQMNR